MHTSLTQGMFTFMKQPGSSCCCMSLEGLQEFIRKWMHFLPMEMCGKEEFVLEDCARQFPGGPELAEGIWSSNRPRISYNATKKSWSVSHRVLFYFPNIPATLFFIFTATVHVWHSQPHTWTHVSAPVWIWNTGKSHMVENWFPAWHYWEVVEYIGYRPSGKFLDHWGFYP